MALKLTLSFMGIWLLVAAIWWLPLPFPVPRPGNKGRLLAAAIAAGALLLVWSAVLIAAVVRVYFGTSPPASLFFGEGEFLGEERWQIFGRSYRGRLAGRQAEVFFFPGHGVRRPLLVIELAAHPAARLGAGRRSPLAAGVDGRTLPSDHAELAGLLLVSPDAEAAQALLAEVAVRAAVKALCADDDNNGVREVALLSDSVRVRWHPISLDAQAVRLVLELMATLAGEAETPRRAR